MKKKTRRILFYFSVLIFLILSFLVVLFALGYQYDFVQNKFVKTGSLELKVNTSAEVYINDNFDGKTSFLGDYFSKSQLLPRVYNVRVQSDGYQSWQKLARVSGGFLTSFPEVVLLRKDFNEEMVASSSVSNISIRQFDPNNGLAFIGNKQKIESINLKNGEKKTIKQLPKTTAEDIDSPDGNKKVRFNEHEVWVEWTKDSNHQPFQKAGDTELITRFSQTITDAQWYKDSEHLIVNVGGILRFIEIDNRDGINIFDISTISGPFYYDKDQDAVFKFSGNKLIRINLK